MIPGYGPQALRQLVSIGQGNPFWVNVYLMGGQTGTCGCVFVELVPLSWWI